MAEFTITTSPTRPLYVGAWVRVDRFNVIQAAHLFTHERGSEEFAFDYVGVHEGRRVRVMTTKFRLGSRLADVMPENLTKGA